jgi:hypothetical protein
MRFLLAKPKKRGAEEDDVGNERSHGPVPERIKGNIAAVAMADDRDLRLRISKQTIARLRVTGLGSRTGKRGDSGTARPLGAFSAASLGRPVHGARFSLLRVGPEGGFAGRPARVCAACRVLGTTARSASVDRPLDLRHART